MLAVALLCFALELGILPLARLGGVGLTQATPRVTPICTCRSTYVDISIGT